MKNKTIQAVVAALAILANGSVRANAQAEKKAVAQTQPVTVTCCSANGMTATVSGTCTCNLIITNIIGTQEGTSTTPTPTPAPTPITTTKAPPAPRPSTGEAESQSSIYDQIKEQQTGRARGDVVRLKGAFKNILSTSATGKIEVPQVGQVYEYRYGSITLVIGSFSLRNPTLNASIKIDRMMRAIIQTAAQDPRVNTMIWYGRRLKGSTEVVEIGESYTSATDLSNTFVTYKPVNSESFYFTTPKNVGGDTYLVDLDPIIKK